MLYHESITRNLPLYCPPSLQVTLRRIGRKKLQFRVEGEGRSFLLRSNRPDVFSFEENKNQLKQFFANAYKRYTNR